MYKLPYGKNYLHAVFPGELPPSVTQTAQTRPSTPHFLIDTDITTIVTIGFIIKILLFVRVFKKDGILLALMSGTEGQGHLGPRRPTPIRRPRVRPIKRVDSLGAPKIVLTPVFRSSNTDVSRPVGGWSGEPSRLLIRTNRHLKWNFPYSLKA